MVWELAAVAEWYMGNLKQQNLANYSLKAAWTFAMVVMAGWNDAFLFAAWATATE